MSLLAVFLVAAVVFYAFCLWLVATGRAMAED